MKKILITAGCVALVAVNANAAKNCCGKCSYNTDELACTENCCDSTGTTESSPDANHIILVTTKKETVTCATSSSGSNVVTCKSTYSCKCEKGYYGTPMANILGGACSGTCTRCPSSGGVYGTTASSGATSITECYIPSGTTRTFSDSVGSGTETITSNCYYSN